MNRTSIAILLVGGFALVGLTGCDRLEQSVTEAIQQTSQTAVQALEEVTRAGSIEAARQAADQVLEQARHQASGLLGQAASVLNDKAEQSDAKTPPAVPATSEL